VLEAPEIARDYTGVLQAVVVGGAIHAVHALPASGRVTIGRYHGSGIAIEDETISRFHAVLHLGPPHTIEDIGSANGTSVDGVAVAPGEHVAVKIGSLIKVGSIVVMLQKRSA
jgi:pSer/pThr/pTyr-binding forkhead associated (FHA) protein